MTYKELAMMWNSDLEDYYLEQVEPTEHDEKLKRVLFVRNPKHANDIKMTYGMIIPDWAFIDVDRWKEDIRKAKIVIAGLEQERIDKKRQERYQLYLQLKEEFEGN